MAERTDFEAEYEQLLHDSERKLVQIQEELEDHLAKHKKCQEDKNSLEEKIASLNSCLKQKIDQCEELKAENDRKKLENNSLMSKSKRYEEENDRLSSEIERIKNTRDALDSQLIDIQMRFSETQEQLWGLQGQTAALTQENVLLKSLQESTKNAMELSENDSKKFSEQLLEARRKLASIEFELKQKLNEAEENFQQTKAKNSILEEKLLKANQSAEKAEDSLRNVLQQHADERASFESELNSQSRISSLYKENIETIERRLNDCETQLEKSQKDKERMNLMLESRIAEERENHAKELIALKQNHNQKLEELKKSFSDQSSNEKALILSERSDEKVAETAMVELRGLTEVEMLDKYINLERELRNEKFECKRIKLNLDKICQEIRHKAPKIAHQKMEYKRAMQNEKIMGERLEKSLDQCRSMSKELSDQKQHRNQLESELLELKQETKDKKTQICNLLKSVVELKYNRDLSDKNEMEEDQASDNENTFTDDENYAIVTDNIVDEHLVTFRDIHQLQEQNQKLLRIVRRLTSERREAVSTHMMVPYTDESQVSSLNKLKDDVKSLSEDRARTAEMLKVVVEQRDMYRALHLKQLQEMSTQERFVGGGESEVIQLRETVEKLKTELNEVKEQAEMRLRSEKSANQGMDEAMQEAVIARQDAAHARADYSFIEKRYNETLLRLESRQVECEKNSQNYFDQLKRNEQLESEKEKILAEVYSLQSDNKRLQSMVDRLTTEKNIAHDNMTRLQNELSNATFEIGRQGALMDSLQKIERAFSARAIEDRKSKEEDMRRTLLELENEKKNHQHSFALIQSQLEAATIETKNIRDKYDDLSAKFNEVNVMYVREQAAAKDLSSKLEMLQNRLEKDTPGATIDFISLQTDLNETKTELMLAKEEATQAIEHLSQYQAIAKARDAQIVEMKNCHNIEIATLKDQLDQEVKMSSKKEEEKVKLSEEMRLVTMGLIRDKDESDKKALAFKIQISEMEISLSDKDKSIQNVKNQCDTLLREIEDYKKNAKNAQENYENEHAHHATTLGMLRTSEEKIELIKKQANEAENKALYLSNELAKINVEWRNERENLAKEISTLKNSFETVQSQNTLLYSQLDKATLEIENIQKEKIKRAEDDAEGGGAVESSGNQEVEKIRQSVAELREVVRYLRKEKDVAEAKNEMTQSAFERQKSILNHTQARLNEARDEILKLSQAPEELVTSRAGHEKLLLQVSQLSSLRESNTLLRSQSNELRKKVTELEAQVGDLLMKVQPSEKEKAEHAAELECLNARLVSAERQAKSWRDRIDVILKSQSRIDPELHKNMCTEFEELKKKSEKSLKDSVESLEKCQAELAATQKELNAMKKNYSSTMDGLKQTNIELNNLKTSHKNCLDSLRSAKKEISANAASLSEKEKELKATKDELVKYQNEKNDLDSKIMADKSSLKKVTEDNLRLKRSFDDLDNKTNKLRGYLRTYKTQLLKAESDRDGYKEKVSALEITVSKMGTASAEESKALGDTSGVPSSAESQMPTTATAGSMTNVMDTPMHEAEAPIASVTSTSVSPTPIVSAVAVGAGTLAEDIPSGIEQSGAISEEQARKLALSKMRQKRKLPDNSSGETKRAKKVAEKSEEAASGNVGTAGEHEEGELEEGEFVQEGTSSSNKGEKEKDAGK